MSLTRRILPGRTYLVTRRCARRCFLLKPVPRLRAIVSFVFCHAASLFGIEVHAVVWLSNHWHLVCTDPRGVLPKFMHLVGTLTARALNAHWGRGENFWAPGSYSAVELLDRAAILDKMVYTIVQAVEAGLVRRPELWPGLHTTAKDVGTQRLWGSRPDFLFRKKSLLPESASIRITKPRAFNDMSDAEFRNLLGELVEKRIEAIHARRKQEGKTRFLGRRAVMQQDPFDSAGDVFPDRGRDPCLSCKDPETYKSERRALTVWRQKQRECWELWRHGKRDVVFPAGTYLMREVYKVRCGEPPPTLLAA